ncbi:MAG: YggS family pyridoxal phosphate-dependent enzyme [Bacteroidetes bacterium]|nr:YggS family pyridoxal phosphate-dependent enzyme [Bacteroidota bacterium]HET6244089.1 YggS family pyridoxal phosphate-dependent enzyme [Bacteroidia bacterium]
MSIEANIGQIKKKLPKQVKLIAVSKTIPIEGIIEAYNSGHKIFGENKVQELVDKMEKLPKDIEWHLIGHLQTNKVKHIASFVSLIHGVDSIKLLKEINKQAVKYNRTIPVLLQIHIASEETKFGLNFKEAEQIIHSESLKSLKNIVLRGFMGMATFTKDKTVIRNEFRSLSVFFNKLKSTINNPDFSELSMGMSGDYEIAIEEGSTMVRVGSAIFGNR